MRLSLVVLMVSCASSSQDCSVDSMLWLLLVVVMVMVKVSTLSVGALARRSCGVAPCLEGFVWNSLFSLEYVVSLSERHF